MCWFMLDNFPDPNLLIAIWSALAATAAAIIAWRVYCWQRSGDVPIVLCAIVDGNEKPEWLEMNLTVRNTTNSRWRATQIHIKKPKGAIGFSRTKGPEKQTPWDSEIDSDEYLAHANNPLPLNFFIDPAGTPRPEFYAGGDVGRDTIFILRSTLNSSRISMMLRLVSEDANIRTVEVPITRDI